MMYVHPREVGAFKSRLSPAFADLAARSFGREGASLFDEWSRFVVGEADWLNAPSELEHGRDLEARLAVLQGPGPRAEDRTNTGPVVGVGADSVGPSDVLKYRRLWDDHVMGTARAAIACADAWDAAATALEAGDSIPANVNAAQFASPPDVKTLRLWADGQRQSAQVLVQEWNAHADTPDWQIVTEAGDILKDFQRVALKAGQLYQPEIARDCPTIPLPKPPDETNQINVIAYLEGAKIVAHGALQLLGIGAAGTLETLGAVGKQIGATVTEVTKEAPGTLKVVAVAAAVVAVAVIVGGRR